MAEDLTGRPEPTLDDLEPDQPTPEDEPDDEESDDDEATEDAHEEGVPA